MGKLNIKCEGNAPTHSPTLVYVGGMGNSWLNRLAEEDRDRTADELWDFALNDEALISHQSPQKKDLIEPLFKT